MSTAVLNPPARKSLKDREVIRRVNALRTTDNITNWFYLAREYLYLGSVIALTIVFYNYAPLWHGLQTMPERWLWDVPVTLVAIVLIGAGQHRLTTLSHEASHYMLFRNRLLNELVSDWLTMFPMWSTTHHYRLQHMAHHQFPNDPERDPDIAQMEGSGHRFDFPMPPGVFIWECVIKQVILFPKLIRYIRVRAKFNATGEGTGPYESKGPKSKLLVVAGGMYLTALVVSLFGCYYWGEPPLLALVPIALWTFAMVFYALVPLRFYRQSIVKGDVSPRWTTFGRITFATALFSGLAWLSRWTDQPWGLYYFLLWLLPIGTMFSFCMILRQVVQHGNGGSGRFTNTRIFLVSHFIRFAVFPLGMDWHLPHHLFPMVPHYRLGQLHDLLMDTEEYRSQAIVVEGYFLHRNPPRYPTVLELMAAPTTR
jgi:fatty acid desaturase